jgi:hypothetical protein
MGTRGKLDLCKCIDKTQPGNTYRQVIVKYKNSGIYSMNFLGSEKNEVEFNSKPALIATLFVKAYKDPDHVVVQEMGGGQSAATRSATKSPENKNAAASENHADIVAVNPFLTKPIGN